MRLVFRGVYELLVLGPVSIRPPHHSKVLARCHSWACVLLRGATKCQQMKAVIQNDPPLGADIIICRQGAAKGKTEAVLEKCLQLPLHPANSAQVQNVLGPNEDYRA